jgi:hypothetical protein
MAAKTRREQQRHRREGAESEAEEMKRRRRRGRQSGTDRRSRVSARRRVAQEKGHGTAEGKPESGHDSAKRGIASGRSPRGAPKEAKEAKHGMNQSRMKKDASKGDQEPPESGVKSKGSVVPERRAVVGGKVER